MRLLILIIHYTILIASICFIKDPVVGLSATIGMMYGVILTIILMIYTPKKHPTP